MPKEQKNKRKTVRKVLKKGIKKAKKQTTVKQLMNMLYPQNPTSTPNAALKRQMELNTSNARGNARQMLLNNVAARGMLGQSAPSYPPQFNAQDIQLRNMKDSNEFQRNENNNIQQALLVERAEKKDLAEKHKQLKKELKEAKSRDDEIATFRKKFKEALDKMQDNLTTNNLQELAFANDDLQSTVEVLELTIKDQERQLKENKLGHQNTLLQQKNEALRAQSESLCKILESDEFNKSLETNAKLLNEQMMLEEQIKMHQMSLDNLHKKFELDAKCSSYPNAEQIDALDEVYTKHIADTNQVVADLESKAAEIDEKRAILGLKQDMYRSLKKKQIEAGVNLQHAQSIHDLLETRTNEITFTDVIDNIETNNDDISKLRDKTDKYNDKIKAKNKLIKESNDSDIEKQRITKRNDLLKERSKAITYNDEIDSIETNNDKINELNTAIKGYNNKIQYKQNLKDEDNKAAAEVLRITKRNDLLKQRSDAIAYDDEINNIETNNDKINELNASIKGYSNRIQLKQNLKDEDNKIAAEVLRLTKRNDLMKTGNTTIEEEITKLISTLSGNDVNYDAAKRTNIEVSLPGEKYTELTKINYNTEHELELLRKKNAAISNKNLFLKQTIKALHGKIGKTNADITVEQNISDLNNTLDKAKSNLQIATAENEYHGTKPYLSKQLELIRKQKEVNNFEEQNKVQKDLNKITKERYNQALLQKFYDKCKEEDIDYKVHAEEIQPSVLADWGITDAESQNVIMQAVAPDAERNAALNERIRKDQTAMNQFFSENEGSESRFNEVMRQDGRFNMFDMNHTAGEQNINAAENKFMEIFDLKEFF